MILRIMIGGTLPYARAGLILVRTAGQLGSELPAPRLPEVQCVSGLDEGDVSKYAFELKARGSGFRCRLT